MCDEVPCDHTKQEGTFEGRNDDGGGGANDFLSSTEEGTKKEQKHENKSHLY